ncbi:major facilitator superfamily domain-containing protein [Cladorrhinum sp. PSN332]|nr:major facilitator superfamily domain-containing protein [Cladorrhinum sp. PSN332]
MPRLNNGTLNGDDESRPLLHSHDNNQSDLVDLSSFDHPLHPVNTPRWRKWASSILLGAMTFVGAFASAAFNAAIPGTAEEFHTTPETMAWSTSLFVFGFATGPIIFGPASEVYGRKAPFFLGYFLFVLAQIPVGLAQDAQTFLVFRFLGGVTSSVCPAIAGGWLADFLLPVERGVAVAIFAATTLIGPGTGAIIGQILVQTGAGWRWIAWTTLILAIVFGGAGFIILPETYLPVLEKRYAKKLRWETKHWAYHSKLDERPITVHDFLTRYLTRPLTMLVLEPILFAMTMYISFTFGLVYLLFVAYPISFVQQRGFSAIGGTLPLLSISAGILLGGIYASWYTLTTFKKKAATGKGIVPEDRLPPMIWGAVDLALGLFLFAWTSSPDMNPWPQILAGVPIGFGVQVILLQSLSYLIDIYTVKAASAISGTMIVRSLLGGTFPVFALRLYKALGVFWATNLLGILAVVMAPIPVVFLYYGGKIRSLGRYD